jgi:hypothetical protein
MTTGGRRLPRSPRPNKQNRRKALDKLVQDAVDETRKVSAISHHGEANALRASAIPFCDDL